MTEHLDVSAPAVEVAVDDVVAATTALSRQEQLQQELEQLQIRRQRLYVARDEVEDNLRTYEVTLRSLEEWASPHRDSYLWRFEERMRQQIAQAEQDMEMQRVLIEEFEAPDTGRLTTIRKRFFKSTTRAAVGALAYLLILEVISANLSSNGQVVPGFMNPLAIALVATIGAVGSWLAALIVYYREWSGFQRYVMLSLGRMQNAGDNVSHAQTELARLRSMHRQTQDWLELLALALHKPWQVRSQWLDLAANDIDSERLPFAVRIAIAQEGDNASGNALDRIAAERLLRPGWRREAFAALIAEVCRIAGLSEERFSLRELDSDLLLAGNGTRKLLREMMINEDVLAKIAEPRLLDIAQEIQTRGFTSTPPPVRLSREFPLESFFFDRSGISELNADQAWDDFLGEVIGTPMDPITPLSPDNLSPSARVRGVHQRVDVYLEMPARLGRLPLGMPDNIYVRVHDHPTVNPMDLVVRAELVGPLAPEDVVIWSSEAEFEPALAIGITTVCRQCGRTDCAEFLSGLECLRTGV